jgi:hypothetical protein
MDPVSATSMNRRTERSRRLEPVSPRGRAAQITVGACVGLAGAFTVWSAWAELTCPYGGPAGREWCRTTVGVGGLFVMAGIVAAVLGAIVLWGGIRRPLDPGGSDGWRWGEAALIVAAGLVFGLQVIDPVVCPDGYRLATGFDLCIAEDDAAVRVEATSQLARQLAAVAGGLILGIVVATWRRLPWVVGAAITVGATVLGTSWFIRDTVGPPW